MVDTWRADPLMGNSNLCIAKTKTEAKLMNVNQGELETIGMIDGKTDSDAPSRNQCQYHKTYFLSANLVVLFNNGLLPGL